MTTQCVHPGEVHSDDLVEVWHGAPEPVYGCGYHALYFADQLFAAHYEKNHAS